MPTPREAFGAAVGSDGRIYAIGGVGYSTTVSTVEAFSPSLNMWTTGLASLPIPLADLGATLGPDGLIYAIGGDNGDYPNGVANSYAYNVLTNTWTQLPNMPTPRRELAVVAGSDGLIYAIGGIGPYNPYGCLGGVLTNVEAYNPKTGSWKTISPLLQCADGLAAVAGPDGRIYAIGGNRNSVQAFNPKIGTWVTVASLPSLPLYMLAAAVAGGGRIYATGGMTAPTVASNSTYAYDIPLNSWTQVADMPTARAGLAAVTGADGRIYAIGGNDQAPCHRLGIVEVYTPPTYGPWDDSNSNGIPNYLDVPYFLVRFSQLLSVSYLTLGPWGVDVYVPSQGGGVSFAQWTSELYAMGVLNTGNYPIILPIIFDIQLPSGLQPLLSLLVSKQILTSIPAEVASFFAGQIASDGHLRLALVLKLNPSKFANVVSDSLAFIKNMIQEKIGEGISQLMSFISDLAQSFNFELYYIKESASAPTGAAFFNLINLQALNIAGKIASAISVTIDSCKIWIEAASILLEIGTGVGLVPALLDVASKVIAYVIDYVLDVLKVQLPLIATTILNGIKAVLNFKDPPGSSLNLQAYSMTGSLLLGYNPSTKTNQSSFDMGLWTADPDGEVMVISRAAAPFNLTVASIQTSSPAFSSAASTSSLTFALEIFDQASGKTYSNGGVLAPGESTSSLLTIVNNEAEATALAPALALSNPNPRPAEQEMTTITVNDAAGNSISDAQVTVVVAGTLYLNATNKGGGQYEAAFSTLGFSGLISVAAYASRAGYLQGVTYAYFTVSLSLAMLSAPANSVYFIFPDGNTAHKKPSGVGWASVTDWTALGFVYGSVTNMPQVIALDTNSAYIDQSTGAPKVSNSVIVLFGGPLVNEVVHYYESNGIAPLHWGLVGGWTAGTEYYYNRTNQAVAWIPLSVLGPESQDMGLIEAFKDPNGNTVIIFSGFGWQGTFVSGLYFKTVLISQLSSMTDSWYIYSWSDTNGNGFAEVNEVNPTPVHGN